MIEEEFYATLKLKNGEEIFAKVAASEEEDRTFLIIDNPIVVTEVQGRRGPVGYKVEPWLKTTTEDMFIINLEDIMVLSESSDIEMMMLHQSFVRSNTKTNNGQKKINRKMGYLANVNDAKEILEKLYKNS